MAGTSRKTGSRIARLPAIGVIAALGLVLTPGTASAAGEITPQVNCIKRVSADADWTAVMGYTNSSDRTVTYPLGPNNVVTPWPQDGRQTTEFRPGTVSGAFTITMNANEQAVWTVSGRSVTITRDGAPDCPPGTQLPADGNGTGTAVALAAAGVIGAAVLVRSRRRDRPSDGPAPVDAA